MPSTNGHTNIATDAKPEASMVAQGMAAYAAPSLFQPHNARQAIRDAHEKKISPLLGIYYGLSSIPVARFLAPLGFDAVWIDWEHTACNVETMTTIVHETMFMSGGRTIPWVRLPAHDHGSICWALDAGASLIFPQVDTVEQAKHIMSAVKFGTAKNGIRSAPFTRYISGITDTPMFGNDLHQSLNNQSAVMIQIESLESIKNLDAILTECPDIDCVWLGTLDTRVSMGLPGKGMNGQEPEWLDVRSRFFETTKKHNKPIGGFAFTPDAVKAGADMYSMMYIGADAFALAALGGTFKKMKEVVSSKTS